MTMLYFVGYIFIGTCWIWGFEYTFQEGEIFGKPGDWLRKNMPDWFNKPTFNCKYCMASVHGTMMYMILSDIFRVHLPWYMWVIYCFSLCGFTAIIDRK